ncbi:MAG: hypothetical protein AMXMBFR58_23880 [Phycisphaerae bacterium]|nr:hypothetical protein [Phycisphaerales bacterium]
MAAKRKPRNQSSNDWRSPPSGYPMRDHRLILWLAAYFDRTPRATRLGLPESFLELTRLFGSHAVELAVSPAPGPQAVALHATDLDWRSGENATTLRTSTTELAAQPFWDRLRVLDTHGISWKTSARRGSGATLHEVWEYSIHQASDWSPAVAMFQIAVRHVADEDLLKTNDFVHSWFERWGRAGAFYARGGFTRLDDNPEIRDQPCWESHIASLIWSASAARTRPIVPGVYRYNFLDATRASLLDLDRVTDGCKKALYETRVRAAAGGVTITVGEISGTSALYLRTTGEDSLSEFSGNKYQEASLWLLYHFSRAGMLAIQNLEWMAEQPEAVEKQILSHRAREAGTTSVGRGGRKFARRIAELQITSPACLRESAQPDSSALLPGAEEIRRDNTTVFAIRAPGEVTGTGFYGAPVANSHLLSSPIRVGSLKPERALFEFDELRHGWDGEQREGPFAPPNRRLKQFKCPTCDGRNFALHTIFEYPPDFEDDLEGEHRSRPQDFFTWFWLHARCTACNWSGIAADIECA